MRASLAIAGVMLATTVAHAEPAEVEHVEKKDAATALLAGGAISLSPSVVSSGGPAGVGLSIGGSF